MKKKFIKLLLLVVLVFGFSFSLASCGKDDEPTNSGSENTPSLSPSQSTEVSSSQEEKFEIDANYYLNLVSESEQDSVVIGFKDVVLNFEDIEIKIDDESYVKLGIKEDNILMNAYLKGQYDLSAWNDKADNLEIWASLDDEAIICRAVRVKGYDFTNKALTNSSAAFHDIYSQEILYKEFTLDKDLLFGYINQFASLYSNQQFDINNVESLNDITSLFNVDTEFVDKAYVAGKLEEFLTMFFESTIDENVTWTFKFDKVKEIVESLKDTTIENIVDTYCGEGTYSNLLTLCNPENTVNIGKYTLNDLLITSEDDKVGYVTPEDVDKTVNTVFDLLPYVMKYDLFDIPKAAQAFLNKDMIIGMFAGMVGETPVKKIDVTSWAPNTTYYVMDQDDFEEVDTATVTSPVAGTEYYVIKDFSELLSDDVLKMTVNELAMNIYASFNMSDPDFDPSTLENFDVTTYVYPMLEQYKDMTVYRVLAQTINMNTEEDDFEFEEVNVTAWEKGGLYFTKNGTDYEAVNTNIVTAPVEGTKYYVIKLITGDDVYNMVKNLVEELEKTTVISFVTSKEAKLLNASLSFDNEVVKGVITFDFTKEYTDELNEGLKPYIPYAMEDEEGSVDSFKEIFNDNIFDNLPNFELVKEDNKIVGFKYTMNGTTETYLFDMPSTSKDDKSELEVEKRYEYGNVWCYEVHMYRKETNDIRTAGKFYYNTETKKFIVKEYDNGEVVQEGKDCSESRVIKYTNKECANDYYYDVHYVAHHAVEWSIEEAGKNDEGKVYYNVYIICDHCNQKVLVDNRCYENEYCSGHETIGKLDIEYKYYPVKEEMCYSENTSNGAQAVTSEYPVTSEVFNGLQITDHKAVKYPNDNIVIIYITVGEQHARNGLIALNANGEVIGRFGSAVINN